MFNLLVLHSISCLQDSPVQIKRDTTEALSVGEAEKLYLIGATVALKVYDILALEGVWLINMLDDMLRGDDSVMFDAVVIVTEWVILYSMKDEMFPDLYGKQNINTSRRLKRLFVYERGKKTKFFQRSF